MCLNLRQGPIRKCRPPSLPPKPLRDLRTDPTLFRPLNFSFAHSSKILNILVQRLIFVNHVYGFINNVRIIFFYKSLFT